MSNLRDTQVAEEYLGVEPKDKRASAINDARQRRIHQSIIEAIIHRLLTENETVSLDKIHETCHKEELQSKRLIGPIANKLIGKEYVRAKEDKGERQGFVYEKGRRYRDWTTALHHWANDA